MVVAAILSSPTPLVLLLLAVGTAVVAAGWWGWRAGVPAHLRSRFVGGMPWGTLVLSGWVLLVYAVLQYGWVAWDQPIHYPFTAWSYFYPLGHLFAGFAHRGPTHLLGNVVGTIVFGTLAEYAWGHYPRAGLAWPRRPISRIVCFVTVGALVTVASVLFAWGPVIGFSGTVFALVGFSVMRLPIWTALGVLVHELLGIVIRGVTDPVVRRGPQPGIDTPPWAEVAIQGHILGFLIGAILALGVGYRLAERTERGPLLRWIGIVLVGAGLGLWQLWGRHGAEAFILHRAIGIGGVLVGAVVLAAAAECPPMTLPQEFPARALVICLVALPVLTMAGVAVPMGLQTVTGPAGPSTAVTVGDYAVYYDTDVRMQWESGVGIGGPPEGGVTRSGLFVRSDSRQLHVRELSPAELKRAGTKTIVLGGIGWRAPVSVNRTGWTPTGNDSVYRVTLATSGERAVGYASPPRQAEPVIAGHEIAIDVGPETFGISVTAPDGEVQRGPVPANGDTVTVGNLTFERSAGRVMGTFGDTQVTVATRD